MDKTGAKSKAKNEVSISPHANKLPPEIVGRFLQNLSVGDRLKGERVSPRWKRALSDWGWTEQRKLNREIVFEGANTVQRGKFTYQQLCSLLLDRVAGANLLELDLAHFECIDYNDFKRYRFPKVARLVECLEKLETLNIHHFPLAAFVDFLPKTLRKISTSHEIRMETFEMLSRRCPDLEEVPFDRVHGVNFGIVNGFLERFPRLKRLSLSEIRSEGAIITSIGQLKELEALSLKDFNCFDEQAFEAMLTRCQRLRELSLQNTNPFNDAASLRRLAELPNLSVLNVREDREGAFTDAVLREIAKRGQLKELCIEDSPTLTDDAIVYLVDRNKSLVNLSVVGCKKITVRSLEAVVSEVQRRREWTQDNMIIFRFHCMYTPIGEQILALIRIKELESGRSKRRFLGTPPVVEENTKKWIEMAAGNPWIDMHPTPKVVPMLVRLHRRTVDVEPDISETINEPGSSRPKKKKNNEKKEVKFNNDRVRVRPIPPNGFEEPVRRYKF